MKIAIITDAWKPQVNGVVTTLGKTAHHLRELGHEVSMITPETFRTVPCPTYPSIRLAIFPKRRLSKMLNRLKPDAIHIATEGPLGLAARRYCQHLKLKFTTSYHTQFPEYLRLRAPIPLSISYAFMRWFHGAAQRTLVPTPTQLNNLSQWRMKNLKIWSRGVDTTLFHPNYDRHLQGNTPIIMYMGRVAIEKNIEAFINLKNRGEKYIVGDGPDLDALKQQHPDIHFVGAKFGEELASHVAAADVFVFPSRTDTFGLVLLESMACGVPVAAYPVTGPIDVVEHTKTGYLDEDLELAVEQALKLDNHACRQHALKFTWENCTRQFADYLEQINREK